VPEAYDTAVFALIKEFEALLDAGDPSIFAWVRGDETVPEAYDTAVFALIKEFEVTK